MKILLFMLLLNISAIAQINLNTISAETPESYESEVDFSTLLPDSLVVFDYGNPLKWQMDNVQDFFMYDGQLSAVLKYGSVYLSSKSCPILLVPEDSYQVLYNGNHIAVVSDSSYYMYSIDYCASYNTIPRSGYNAVLADNLICESGYNSRKVIDIFTGNIVYSDEKNAVTATGYGASCYYLGDDGKVDRIDYDGEILETVFDLNRDIRWASNYNKHISSGFSVYTQEELFTVEFVKGVYPDVKKSRAAFCTGTVMSDEQYCGGSIEGEIVASGTDSILSLSNNILSAYDKQKGWLKEVMSRYFSYGCIYEGTLYFNDIAGKIYKVDNNHAVEYSAIPEGCDYENISFNDGIFYNNNNFLFQYAEKIKEAEGKVIYRAVADGKYIYYAD